MVLKAQLTLVSFLILNACARPQLDRTGQNPKATSTPTASILVVTETPVPTASPTSTSAPVCMETTGNLLRLAFPDPVQRSKSIPFNLYLPPCYDTLAQEYPVLYLLHGYPQDQDHWLDLGLIDILETQQVLSDWPAFIIVLPLQPEPYFTHTDGGPGSWEAVMLEGLIPYIDANYRTLAKASDRALVGISRGGVWALEIGLRNPQVFDTVGALSPALIVNHPRASYDPTRIVQDSDLMPGHLWLSIGDSEPSFRLGIDRFAAVLDQEGISYTYDVYSGKHEDAAWATIIQPVIEFVISGWEAHDPG